MKFEIEVDENGQITLKKDNEIVLISRYMPRVCDIVLDMHENNGESLLLKPSISKLSEFFSKDS